MYPELRACCSVTSIERRRTNICEWERRWVFQGYEKVFAAPTFILANFCIFAGRHDRIPQSSSSSSSTMSSMWWAFSRSIKPEDGWRLWHFITVSGTTDDVMALVVTEGFVSVVETVTLCVCTGSKFVVTVMVLGNDSDSVSCGRSALLSSCVSEYSPVISYCDSCRLSKRNKNEGMKVSMFVCHLILKFFMRLLVSAVEEWMWLLPPLKPTPARFSFKSTERNQSLQRAVQTSPQWKGRGDFKQDFNV